ncbi:MAG TPA: hypothetical protein DCZ94_18190 [Lentisphaeria bacterium]|nr:MAG: hypothetical protein A2X48_23000 [Lentisphaerae bacterium GWF2_49_21]HBC88877.1 hypothetical protein [Lentisphaeria bacterium]
MEKMMDIIFNDPPSMSGDLGVTALSPGVLLKLDPPSMSGDLGVTALSPGMLFIEALQMS